LFPAIFIIVCHTILSLFSSAYKNIIKKPFLKKHFMHTDIQRNMKRDNREEYRSMKEVQYYEYGKFII